MKVTQVYRKYPYSKTTHLELDVVEVRGLIEMLNLVPASPTRDLYIKQLEESYDELKVHQPADNFNSAGK